MVILPHTKKAYFPRACLTIKNKSEYRWKIRTHIKAAAIHSFLPVTPETTWKTDEQCLLNIRVKYKSETHEVHRKFVHSITQRFNSN